jgi:hypothetical protein
MKRSSRIALKTGALSMLILVSPVRWTSAQDTRSYNDRYGIGPMGTIGRGTYILPGSPPHPAIRTSNRGFDRGRTSGEYAAYSFVSRNPSIPTVPSQPYLTGRTYEPGDGYRYPVYYNPATRSYIYYPVRP